MHYSMAKPHCSNFWIITAIFWGVQIFLDFYGKLQEPCSLTKSVCNIVCSFLIERSTWGIGCRHKASTSMEILFRLQTCTSWSINSNFNLRALHMYINTDLITWIFLRENESFSQYVIEFWFLVLVKIVESIWQGSHRKYKIKFHDNSMIDH